MIDVIGIMICLLCFAGLLGINSFYPKGWYKSLNYLLYFTWIFIMFFIWCRWTYSFNLMNYGSCDIQGGL